MKALTLIFCIFFLMPLMNGQQYGRLESEYKLAVPPHQREALWQYLQDSFITRTVVVGGIDLNSELSREKFLDQYFDTKDRVLSKHNAGLRFRKRYLNDQLLKSLIQLKLPQDSSGMTRNEIKFDVDEKPSPKDFSKRHPFLKYLKSNDQENLNFHLAPLSIRAEDMMPSISLRQYRDRIYMTDSLGSIATITLDKVNNLSFPFQGFVEMEIELNEIRYTAADATQTLQMDSIREGLKSKIMQHFPDLIVDQTPKYNKLEILIDNNILSKIASNFMWFIFAGIVLLAVAMSIVK